MHRLGCAPRTPGAGIPARRHFLRFGLIGRHQFGIEVDQDVLTVDRDFMGTA
jgi:hypothetical protein